MKFFKHRTKARNMPRFIGTMADRTDPSASERAGPPTLDNITFHDGEPFERRTPDLATLIRVRRSTGSSRRSAWTRGFRPFALVDSKTIMELDPLDDRIKSSCFDTSEAGPELVDNFGVTNVNGPQEKHYHQNLRNVNLAARELHDDPIEARPILMDRLVGTLHVVEKRQKRGESISDRVRAAMVHERSQHLKATAIVEIAFVVKKILEGAILDSQAELTFPNPTCVRIGGVRDKRIVRSTSRKIGNAKKVLDQIVIVQKRFLILERAELERIHGPRSGHVGRSRRQCSRHRSRSRSRNTMAMAITMHQRRRSRNQRRTSGAVEKSGRAHRRCERWGK
jgi:hypothetical protein